MDIKEKQLKQPLQQITTLRQDTRLSIIVDIKKNNLNNLYNYEQRFARTLVCLQYLDMKKNNSNNKYNK